MGCESGDNNSRFTIIYLRAVLSKQNIYLLLEWLFALAFLLLQKEVTVGRRTSDKAFRQYRRSDGKVKPDKSPLPAAGRLAPFSKKGE